MGIKDIIQEIRYEVKYGKQFTLYVWIVTLKEVLEIKDFNKKEDRYLVMNGLNIIICSTELDIKLPKIVLVQIWAKIENTVLKVLNYK